MTAAVFEAVFVPPWVNEINKTKLHFTLSPAVGINTVLAVVGLSGYGCDELSNEVRKNIELVDNGSDEMRTIARSGGGTGEVNCPTRCAKGS
jgi:hypothetical protein